MTLILKQADLRVTRLSSIEITLAWLASHDKKGEKSILIIDVSGADLEEEQIFQQLHDNGSNLPIIIISPYGNAEINPGKKRPINYRNITTPFSPEELLSCVKKISKREHKVTEDI